MPSILKEWKTSSNPSPLHVAHLLNCLRGAAHPGEEVGHREEEPVLREEEPVLPEEEAVLPEKEAVLPEEEAVHLEEEAVHLEDENTVLLSGGVRAPRAAGVGVIAPGALRHVEREATAAAPKLEAPVAPPEIKFGLDSESK